jgi:hypothetical protein
MQLRHKYDCGLCCFALIFQSTDIVPALPPHQIRRNQIHTKGAMIKIKRKTAVVLGTVAVAHYLGANYGSAQAPDDLLQPPPLSAAVVTATVTSSTIAPVFGSHELPTIFNAITDDEHKIVAPDQERIAKRK